MMRKMICLALLTAPLARGAEPEPDAALEAPPVVVETGSEYAPDTRPFQGIPGIAAAPGGRLWATWYGGGPSEGPENYVMLATSADGGTTWSGVKLVIDPPGPVRAFDPVLWVDPAGKLWLFWAQGWSHWDGRAGVWAIMTEEPDAEDPKWSEPRRLCDGIMMNKPTVLASGEWLLPVAIWGKAGNSRHRNFDLTDRGPRVVVSEDGGKTFAMRGVAEVPDEQCDEHMIVERRDGSLWMLVRRPYGIAQSTSTDGGRTWAKGEPAGLSNVVSRFFIRRLASGNLILVTNDPPDGGKKRSHLRAKLSTDNGASWSEGLLLDERVSTSYPDGDQTADGTIRIIYDISRRGDKQILLARFTEAELAAGKISEPGSALRLLVNQATGVPPPKPAN